MEYARNQITALGYEITEENATALKFVFKGSTVTLFPYSGWHTGKTIQDGRGHWETIKTDTPIKEEPPDVTDTPGVRYAVTESDVMVDAV